MELTKNLPSTEEIVRALGLNGTRGSGQEMLPGLALFGAGILVGAGLALLFAPVTGEELREEISHRAGDLKEELTHRAGEIRDRVLPSNAQDAATEA